MLLKAFAIFVILVLLTLFNIWWERRVVARMQHRIGPNRNGPFGRSSRSPTVPKLMFKEDLTPRPPTRWSSSLAPLMRGDPGVRRRSR